MISLDELATSDRFRGAMDFIKTAVLLHRHGSWFDLQKAMEYDPLARGRVADMIRKADLDVIMKADVSGLTSSSGLADYGSISAAFIASLSNSGAFDYCRSNGSVRVPTTPGPPIRATTAATLGDSDPREGAAHPIGRIEVEAALLTRKTPMGIVALSRDLLRLNPDGIVDLVSRELRRAIIGSVDVNFLGSLVNASDTPSISASADPLADLSSALDELEVDTSARLVLFAPAAAVRHMALNTNATTGARTLPELTVNGGRIANIQILPSDWLVGSPAIALLVDATGIATGDDGLELGVVEHTSLEMSDTPLMSVAAGSPLAPVASQLVSLWQTNTQAMFVKRSIAWGKVRALSCCVLDGVGW